MAVYNTPHEAFPLLCSWQLLLELPDSYTVKTKAYKNALILNVVFPPLSTQWGFRWENRRCKYSKIYRNHQTFIEKEWLKKQKIADLSFCFEFQVVVAVVGFLWHSWGNAKMADLRSRNAFKSLPQRNALISIFNGFGFYFSILHRLWICHATLMI